MTSPFLKWAGGKRWLIYSDKFPTPRTFENYIEPFLGSGAVFFHLRPKSSILADINQDLIDVYRVIKDDPKKLTKLLKKHQKRHCKEYYYLMRSLIINSMVERAARFIYINRTCWNGIYRVNKHGLFNVPIGDRETVIRDVDDFESISELLRGADLYAADFEITIDMAKGGDFLFIDPPYTVKHNKDNFIKYNERLFS